MSTSNPTLRIDIVSDVVCPWCVIGYRQLARALEATGTAHEIHWHPFELNPSMPPEGQNLLEHVAGKYGSTREESEQSRARMTEIGAALGFEFRFSDDMRMHNTFNAHQLLHWAERQGRMNDLSLALLRHTSGIGGICPTPPCWRMWPPGSGWSGPKRGRSLPTNALASWCEMPRTSGSARAFTACPQ